MIARKARCPVLAGIDATGLDTGVLIAALTILVLQVLGPVLFFAGAVEPLCVRSLVQAVALITGCTAIWFVAAVMAQHHVGLSACRFVLLVP
ncbi:MAG: hypothetical protein ABIK86_04545 [candidate division WOR-3 bacterium]